jgi:hypothetical protein
MGKPGERASSRAGRPEGKTAEYVAAGLRRWHRSVAGLSTGANMTTPRLLGPLDGGKGGDGEST